jgi:hypothetical protein
VYLTFVRNNEALQLFGNADVKDLDHSIKEQFIHYLSEDKFQKDNGLGDYWYFVAISHEI